VTITAGDSAVYRRLRAVGATPLEAAIVLSVVQELDNVIELAEARGAHGRWTSGGGGGTLSAKDMKRIQAMRTKAHNTASATVSRDAKAKAAADARAKAAANTDGTPKSAAPGSALPSPVPSDLQAPSDMPAEHVAFVQKMADMTAQRHAEKVLEQTQKNIKKATDDLEAADQAEDKKAHRIALAAHVGIISSGGVLAFIEAKMGTPGTVQAVSAMAPSVIQELVDWYKDL
jgi:hypothetical protein